MNITSTTSDNLLGGYTHDALSAAFDKVADPSDWRAPIDAIIKQADLSITTYAIRFFTATDPQVWYLADNKARVTSNGYRLGPAGDH